MTESESQGKQCPRCLVSPFSKITKVETSVVTRNAWGFWHLYTRIQEMILRVWDSQSVSRYTTYKPHIIYLVTLLKTYQPPRLVSHHCVVGTLWTGKEWSHAWQLDRYVRPVCMLHIFFTSLPDNSSFFSEKHVFSFTFSDSNVCYMAYYRLTK